MDRQSIAFTQCATVGITLVAPALGGSTEVWSQAIISILVGLLLFVAPPKRSLGLLPNACFLALLLLALDAFLPAGWFPTADWRSALSNFGITLPQTRSPQPWLTLHSTLLLVLGVAWAYYLLAYEWNPQGRERVWILYAIGILMLAVALIAGFLVKSHVPFWPNVPGFGFFPNRNQTSNVLGLGGIMIYAIGMRRLQEMRNTWSAWFASLAIICWALIVNYSRSGILLFFGGAFAWHCYWLITSSRRRVPALTFCGLLFLVAIFLLNGGETLARFSREALFSPQDARISTYRDAFALLMRWPVLGIGLANFPAIFSIYRQYSVADNDVIHPESDWLWAMVEMGWPVALLLLILFVWWVRQCLWFEPGTSRLLRMAAFVCGCAFAVHAVFDVSAHRIGALWPALFLASTALHPANDAKSSPTMPPLFRIVGLFLMCTGVWWLISPKIWPTSATLNGLEKRIGQASDRDDYSVVSSLASEALQIAPLEWSLYYKRGAAEAALFQTQSGQRDFQIARYLMPYWPPLRFDQGRVWIEAGKPDLAFDVWTEALQRWPERAASLYRQIFGVIKSQPDLMDRWRDLAHTDTECLLFFLQNAQPFEFRMEVERLLTEDPQLRSLAPNELGTLFSAWYDRGDKLELAEVLQTHPGWQKIGWRQLARVYADYQDYRQAYETVRKFDAPPEFPQKNSHEGLDEARARFEVNRTDINNGLALYFAQLRAGQNDAALVTLRKLIALPGSPKSLSCLEGELWAQNGQWKNAWEAVAHFEFQR